MISETLLKWTFAQNQCYRFSNEEQLSCSKFFDLPHKNGRKIWISKHIVPFQMYSSFKFYLSNEASNELLPKTKVVDLEILSKFGIQKFFVWPREKGEKLNLQTRVLNFALFTILPSLHFPSLFLQWRRSPSNAVASPSSTRRRAVQPPSPLKPSVEANLVFASPLSPHGERGVRAELGSGEVRVERRKTNWPRRMA